MKLGNSLPRLQYGFRAGFNYYGFGANIFFRGTGNHYWYPESSNMPFWGFFSTYEAALICAVISATCTGPKTIPMLISRVLNQRLQAADTCSIRTTVISRTSVTCVSRTSPSDIRSQKKWDQSCGNRKTETLFHGGKPRLLVSSQRQLQIYRSGSCIRAEQRQCPLGHARLPTAKDFHFRHRPPVLIKYPANNEKIYIIGIYRSVGSDIMR